MARNFKVLRRAWNASLWSEPRAAEVAWVREYRLQCVVLASAMVAVLVSITVGFGLGRTRGGRLAAALVFVVGAGVLLAVDYLWKL